MTFLWPALLYLLALIPILVGIYVWSQRRRRRFALRYSSLSLLRDAVPYRSAVRRHLPFAVFLIALASLLVTAARPVSIATVPTGGINIILAIDVSRSMCSTDVYPSRLLAAEAAANSFVQHQNASTQIGIVAFSDFAEEIQSPTSDQEILQTAIDSLIVGRRTAIGSAILKSLDAIAEVDKGVAPSTPDGVAGAAVTPVPKGAYAPDIIVLLTDGVSNTGPLPLDAAQQASDRGVRVYTIGFGTPDGSSFPDCNSQSPTTQSFGFGGGTPPYGGWGLGGFRRGIDEAALQQVSDMTGAKYYSASSAGELEQVFRQLPLYVVMKHKTTEISFLFALAGAALALIAISLSLLWHSVL